MGEFIFSAGCRRLFGYSLVFVMQIFPLSCKDHLSRPYKMTSRQLNFLQGKFEPAEHKNFQRLPSDVSLRKHLYLQKEVKKAFLKMKQAAKKSGVRLYVLSATRSFFHQKKIWEAKFSRRKKAHDVKASVSGREEQCLDVLKFSAMPGTSRHHWGTEIDIIFDKKMPHLKNSIFEQGKGLRVYNWLKKNAMRFGFCQPYKTPPQKRNPRQYKRGHEEEKWHWSYKPLARAYLSQYASELKRLIPARFTGARTCSKFFEEYIFNIHSDCR